MHLTIKKTVREIRDEAYHDRTDLESVTIPEGVTKIGADAFSGCTGLTSVTIPEGMKEIGRSAFDGCTGLTSVTIPEGMTEIGGSAFRGCTGLTSVTIPAGVTKIDSSAFAGCTGLTRVTIAEGVTEICRKAFAGCTGLTSVTIPKTVTEIGDLAFKGCSELTDIVGSAGVRAIGFHAFWGCPKLDAETPSFGRNNHAFHNSRFCGKTTQKFFWSVKDSLRSPRTWSGIPFVHLKRQNVNKDGRGIPDGLRTAIETDSPGAFQIQLTLTRKKLSATILREVLRENAIGVLEDLLTHAREKVEKVASLTDILLYACWTQEEKGLMSAIELLEQLEPGICASARDKNGYTPLIYTAMNPFLCSGRPVDCLVDHGCDPNLRAKDGVCFNDIQDLATTELSPWTSPWG